MEIQSFVSDEQKVQEMGVELKRLRQENKELHQLLDAMNFKYSNLQEHVEKMKQEMLGLSSSQPLAHQQLLMKGSHPIQQPKPNTSRILVRTNEASPSLVVKDGYHWKKYGQKVTKDNPSPRAYFRCSVAPICHVKKKVQRSADDQSILVATYEGEHNHPKPRPGESSGLEAAEDESNKKSVTSHIHPAIALDLTLSMNNQINDSSENTGNPDVESSHNSIKNINSETVDEYVNLLARDPNIKASLVGALANYVQNNYRSEG